MSDLSKSFKYNNIRAKCVSSIYLKSISIEVNKIMKKVFKKRRNKGIEEEKKFLTDWGQGKDEKKRYVL